MEHPEIVLKQKRAEILKKYRHPWVFSKGLKKKPDWPSGSMVRVVSEKGEPLGSAVYQANANIALRMVSFSADPWQDEDWRRRLEKIWKMRRKLLPQEQAFRLIHGENDGFPGLTADYFGPWICVQVTGIGMDRIKGKLAQMLAEVIGVQAVYERSQGYVRRQDGLQPAEGFLLGKMSFPCEIQEGSLTFSIDPSSDQKTGFFLDQRSQRAWVTQMAQGKKVLDLCCYTGGFSLAALQGGAAKVLAVDISAQALARAREGVERNGLDGHRFETVNADLFSMVKQPTDDQWDLVVCDPPSLAKSLRAVDRAQKAYTKLHRNLCGWIPEGGLLLTFSCTGVVSPQSFRQSVFLGIREAGREAVIIDQFGAGPDHPINLRFPEGEYLKGLALYFTD